MNTSAGLDTQYKRRFEARAEYRDAVWKTINKRIFAHHLGAGDAVLDLGCGWGEFIRNIEVETRMGMDLNPDSGNYLGDDIRFIEQDCSQPWPLDPGTLDLVFSSNFLEHLPDKEAIEATLSHAHRALRDGGKLILMGPNIRYLPGAYWDFWDHHVALSDRSVVELLELIGFSVERNVPRFMPYTMSEGREAPIFLVDLYLRWPWIWRLFGKQFLVVATKCV